jgi:hypothetical protein
MRSAQNSALKDPSAADFMRSNAADGSVKGIFHAFSASLRDPSDTDFLAFEADFAAVAGVIAWISV